MEEIQQHIIPLYKEDIEEKRPVFVGTSVFINILGLNVILTAAHVIDYILPNRILYPHSENEFKELNYLEIRKLGQNYDIAICIINQTSLFYKPLGIDLIDMFKGDEQYQHLLVGCPASTTKHSNKNKQEIRFEGYLTNAASEKEYKRLKLDSTIKVVVKFQKENVFKENMKKHQFYDPYGMSGGAIFQFSEMDVTNVKLVGIITDWDKNKKNVIIGTRIEKILESFTVYKIG